MKKSDGSGEFTQKVAKCLLTKRDDSKTQMRHKNSAAKQAKLVVVQANKSRFKPKTINWKICFIWKTIISVWILEPRGFYYF